MLKSKKKSYVEELEGIYGSSSSVIVTHYHGLTVAQITNLRRILRDKGAGFKVVKNTLSNIAAKKAGVAHDENMYIGPTAIAFSKDPIAAAKGVMEFVKTNDNLKVIGGVVDGATIDVKSIEQLAKMPSLDELRSILIGLLQAPATKVARVLQAPAGSLARVVKAYSEK